MKTTSAPIRSDLPIDTLPPADESDLPDLVGDLAVEGEVASLPEPIQRRLMAVLFSSQSVFSAAQIVSFTPLPLAAVYLTGNEATAGWPSTVTLVGRALIAYPVGWMMVRLGRRLGVSIGLGTSVVATILCGVAIILGSFPLFLVGALINGFGRGASEQSRYAAADIRPGAQAAKAIGTIVFAGTIGALVGPLLIAPSAQAAELRGLPELSGPYFLTAALAFVAFALVFLFLRPEPRPYVKPESGVEVDSGRPLRAIFAQNNVQFAVAALGISQLVMVMVMVITPLHMQHEAHSTQDISWVIMAHTLGMFGLSGFTGWLAVRFGQVTVVMLAGLTLAAAAIMTPFVHSVPMLALSLFLLGLGWNFGFVAGSALLAAAVTGVERGRTQGASETLVASAAALGSFGSGFAFLWGGMIAVCAIGLALAMALVAARLLLRPQAAVLPAGAD
ncbi:MAG: MFS transporter [Caldilineaceae bacterium]